MTTIAVIDDDAMLIDLTGELLRERGWSMVSSRDANTAGHFLRQARPDAILLDVHLGGSHRGWDILERVKSEPGICTIPVIVWSGDLRMLETKREWLQHHHIPVLPKPFEIDDLYRSLDKALGISVAL
jgi:two-component system cell cycle response regulator